MKNTAVGYGNFATMDWLNGYSLLIAAVSKGKQCHVGPFFIMSDHTMIYYEMQFNEGITGPKPFERLFNWSRVPGHSLHIRHLHGVTAESAEKKRQQCEQWKREKLPYAKSQMAAKLLCEWRGWPVQTDPNYMDCSEMTSTLDMPKYDCRDARRTNHDSVTPVSLWRKLNELIREEGATLLLPV